MNLGLLYLPNLLLNGLNHQVKTCLDYIEQRYKIPYKVVKTDNHNINQIFDQNKFIDKLDIGIVHQGFYVVLITEREEEPLNNPYITYVRTRVEDETSFTFQFQKRHKIKDLSQDVEPFMACLFTNCLNRDIMYYYNRENFVFRLPDRRTPYFPISMNSKTPSYSIGLRVYPMCNWCSTQDLIKMWKYMEVPNQLRWESDISRADYFLVINSTNIELPYPERTIYFTMEPQGEKLYESFLQKYQGRLLYQGLHKNALNFVELHTLIPSLEQIQNNNKLKALSAIVSDKDWDVGHKFRLEVLHKLDKMSERGFPLHIYGLCVKQQFQNYKGQLPDHNKQQGLLPYQYHFNVENQWIDNYVTEKIYDSMVNGCCTFYHGASNICKFFPSESLIDVGDNVDQAVKLIIDKIKSDIYLEDKTIQTIQQSRNMILNKFSPASRLQNIVRNKQTTLLIRNDTIKPQQDEQKIIEMYQKQGWTKATTMKTENKSLQNFIELCNLSIQHKINLCVINVESINMDIFEKTSYYNNDIIVKISGFSSIEQALIESSYILTPKGAEKVIMNIKQQKSIFDSIDVGCF